MTVGGRVLIVESALQPGAATSTLNPTHNTPAIRAIASALDSFVLPSFNR